MSNALICDACGQTFPEGAEGSVSGNGTFTRTVDGVRKEMQRRQDQCPICAEAQAQQWNGARTLETAKRVVRTSLGRNYNMDTDNVEGSA